VPEASARLTRKTADTLGLRKGENVLDAGCGAGAEATQVAEEYGVQVTGITISPGGCDIARERAESKGLSDRVKFEVGDYHALELPDGEFDAVIAIEALMHAMDLNKALLEFHRVLRPGGRITMSEMVKATDASPAKKPFPQAREPMTADEWVKEFEAAGFVIDELTLCGRRVYVNSGKHLLNRHDEVRGLLEEQFGEEITEEIRTGMKDAFHLGPEHVNYMILCARKK